MRLAAAVLLLLLLASAAAAEVIVRVGFYENKPKLYTQDGEYAGLFPDLVMHIAEQEGWQVVWVPGTWTECLQRLERGDIDVMPDVAWSRERAEKYAFGEENVLVNWGTVYVPRGTRRPESLLELNGKRVAVMRGNILTTGEDGIYNLANRFGVTCSFIETDSLAGVFTLLASGRADAGVVNRLFGLGNERDFAVEATSIVFGPSRLHFAFPPQGRLNSVLQPAFDRHLRTLKAQQHSFYYRTLDRYFGGGLVEEVRPEWLDGAILTVLLLLATLMFGVYVLRRQVRRATAHLSTANRALRLQSRCSTVVVHAGEEQKLLERICALAADEGGYRLAWVGFAMPDTERTIRKAAVAGPAWRMLDSLTLSWGDGQAGCCASGRAIRSGEVVVLRAPECRKLDAAWQAALRAHGIVALCAVPLAAHGDIIGAFTLGAGEENAFDAAEVTLLAELGETLAHGIMALRAQQGRREALAALEEARAQLEQRVAERTAELNVAKERAESADRLKSAFLATMSHELRTPLNSIIGFTGIILQELAGPVNAEQRKQLDMVRGSARHLLALINDVLDISKIEAGQMTVVREPFDLDAVAQRTVAGLRPLAEKKGLTLTLSGSGGQLSGDERRVGQVLLNLISNAVKFTEQGSVTVTLGRTATAVCMAVHDTGIGIKAEDRDALFRPFRQIDSGLTRKHDGTGLGLSICKKLTELMGGSIAVVSEFGQGSTFTVTLPLMPEA